MKKAFVTALTGALLAGLALAAISGGASARTSSAALDDANARAGTRGGTFTYKGSFKQAGPDTVIKIKATTQRGEPVAIKSMSYRGLPASCTVSGDVPISGGWTLAGVGVNDRRKFRAVGDDGGAPGEQSSLRFKGKFNRSFQKVRGKFQTTSYFPPDNPPEETCVSETKRYGAKR